MSSVKPSSLAAVSSIPKLPLLELQETAPTASPPEYFKNPALVGVVGPRGGGKTYSTTQYIKLLQDRGYVTRTFVMSPTYKSNDALRTLYVREGDVYEDIHGGRKALQDIQEKMEADVKAYQRSKVYAATLKRMEENKARGRKFSDETVKDRAFVRDMQDVIKTRYEQLYLDTDDKEIDKLPLKERELLEWVSLHGFQFPPENEDWPMLYPATQLPSPHGVLIIDDMSHSDIYTNSGDNPFVNLCLRHRHVGGVAGCGLSIYMLVQTFKQGVPRAIRANCTQFFLFRTADQSVLEDIYQEFGALCTKDQFYDLYMRACGETDTANHDFLIVDKNPQNKEWKFRKNFHEILYPASDAGGAQETFLRKQGPGEEEELPPKKKPRRHEEVPRARAAGRTSRKEG